MLYNTGMGFLILTQNQFICIQMIIKLKGHLVDNLIRDFLPFFFFRKKDLNLYKSELKMIVVLNKLRKIKNDTFQVKMT